MHALFLFRIQSRSVVRPKSYSVQWPLRDCFVCEDSVKYNRSVVWGFKSVLLMIISRHYDLYRDKTKRPLMGAIAAKLSSKTILTSDNPRNEDPNQILEEMQTQIAVIDRKKVLVIENRKQAIKTACMLAEEEDIILIAGKGHEDYQDIKGVKHHFDDKEELLEAFKELNK